MDRKKINQIALESYTNDFLDEKKVNRISVVLSRSDLKKYIKALKNIEKKKSLIISAPFIGPNASQFEKLFPNKKIVLIKDPSLMLGVQIVDNDIVYDFSLKNTLGKIISYIEKDYD